MLSTSATKVKRVANMVNNRSKNQKHFVRLEISRYHSSVVTFQSLMVIMVVVAIRLLVFVALIHTGKRDLLPGDLLDKTWVS